MKLLTLSILFLSLTVGQTVSAAQIYKWTDNKGVTHFSDSPPPSQASDKEKIALPDIKAPAPAPQYSDSQQVAEPLTAATSAASHSLTAPQDSTNEITPEVAADNQSKAASSAIQQDSNIAVEVTNLQNDQTIRSNRGFITVQVNLSRKLGIGESLQLMMDTQPYGAPQTQPLWELQNIDRGTHTFSVNVVESGKVIASSKTITVHLHRTTVK